MSNHCPCITCEFKGCGSYHDQCNKYQDWSKARKNYIDLERQRKKDDLLFSKPRRIRKWNE